VATLEHAYRIAKDQGLHFPYIGNVPGNEGENTYCPECGTILVERYGYRIGRNRILNGKCAECDTNIPGVWH
jgi:pyruvate formate lyase activating enzyme